MILHPIRPPSIFGIRARKLGYLHITLVPSSPIQFFSLSYHLPIFKKKKKNLPTSSSKPPIFFFFYFQIFPSIFCSSSLLPYFSGLSKYSLFPSPFQSQKLQLSNNPVHHQFLPPIPSSHKTPSRSKHHWNSSSKPLPAKSNPVYHPKSPTARSTRWPPSINIIHPTKCNKILTRTTATFHSSDRDHPQPICQPFPQASWPSKA